MLSYPALEGPGGADQRDPAGGTGSMRSRGVCAVAELGRRSQAGRRRSTQGLRLGAFAGTVLPFWSGLRWLWRWGSWG